MRLKRFLSLLLAVLMAAALFAGCSKPAQQPADGGNAATPTEGKTEDKKEIIKVSMNVMEAEKCGNNPKSDFITEKFGIEYEYVPVTWGDWNEKIRTWISTGDTPDLIWWDLKGGGSNEYRSWARQGAFRDIPEDKINANPNLKALVDKMKSDDVLKVDGKLYAWPSYRNQPPEAKDTYDSYWVYRRDWAKAVGLWKEDDVYTWDEWVALCKAVLEKDPGKNGKGNTAGMVMPPWAYPHAPTLFIGPPAAEGNETCSYIKVDGKYVWPPSLPEYKDGVKRAWQLYQDGIIWKDNMQFKANEDQDLFKASRAFAKYAGGIGTFNTLTDELLKNNFTTDKEAVGPALILDPQGTMWMTQTEDYWTVTGFSSKVDDKKMDKVLEVWNWLVSDEGRIFQQLGFEGKDYKKGADGKIEVLWQKDPKSGMYVSPYAEMRFGEYTPSALLPSPSPTDNEYGVKQKQHVMDMMAKYPLKLKEFDYQMSFFSATNKDKYGNYGMDVKAKLSDLIATSKNIEADWDAFIKTMMPRVQPIIDELNNGIK